MNGKALLFFVHASILGAVLARSELDSCSDATNVWNCPNSESLLLSTIPLATPAAEPKQEEELLRAFETIDPFARTTTNLLSVPLHGAAPMIDSRSLESRLCAFATEGPESRYGRIRSDERSGPMSGARVVWGEKYSPDEVLAGRQRNRIARRILLEAMKERLPLADEAVQRAYLYAASSLWVVGHRGADGGGAAETRRKEDGIPSEETILEWFANNGALCDSVRAEARKQLAKALDGKGASLRGAPPFFATPAPTDRNNGSFRRAEDELLQIFPLALQATNGFLSSTQTRFQGTNDLPSAGLAARLIRFATLPEDARQEADHRMAMLAFLSARCVEMEEDVQMRWFLACVRIWIQPPPSDGATDVASSRRKADGIPSASAILEWFAGNEDLCDTVRTAAQFRLEHLSSLPPSTAPTLTP